MYVMIRLFLVLAVAGSASACGDVEDGVSPEAQQLARVNRELAALRQMVETLHTRVDRVVPAASSPATRVEKKVEPPLIVAIVAAADVNISPRYLIDGRPVAEDELVDAVQTHAARVADAGVQLVAPTEVAFERVLHVMDMLHGAGVARISLITRPEKESTAP